MRQERTASSAKPNLDYPKEENHQPSQQQQDQRQTDETPLVPSLIYNCSSRQASAQMRSYLSKLYLDLVEGNNDKQQQQWRRPINSIQENNNNFNEDGDYNDEDSQTQETEFLDLPTSATSSKTSEIITTNSLPSPFPKIVPIPNSTQQDGNISNKQPRSIMKNSSSMRRRKEEEEEESNSNEENQQNVNAQTTSASKYERRLYEVYKQLADERLRRLNKNEYDLDLDDDDLFDDDPLTNNTSSGNFYNFNLNLNRILLNKHNLFRTLFRANLKCFFRIIIILITVI